MRKREKSKPSKKDTSTKTEEKVSKKETQPEKTDTLPKNEMEEFVEVDVKLNGNENN